MTQILEELTMLADILDVGGFKSEAEDLDAVIRYATEQKIDRKWTREVEILVDKVQKMLYNSPNISDDLYNNLITDLNKYLIENEEVFKEKDLTDRSFALKENQIVMNLKNLLSEIPKGIDEMGRPRALTKEEEQEKISDTEAVAKNMQVFRSLEASENDEDKAKARLIRESLGEETIKNIEILLQTRANSLRINELTLPPVLLMALRSYRDVESKILLIRSKLQDQEAEIKNISEELGKQNLRYTQNWSQERIDQESTKSQEMFNKKEYLESMQSFYRTQFKERESKIKEHAAHIRLLNTQLQIVAGANAETAKQIRDEVGVDNIKALIEIGNSGGN